MLMPPLTVATSYCW